MKACAIPTTYNNVNFRSRLEAKWAAFFDLVGWRWEYEAIDLPGYIPDFCLLTDSGRRIYVEVKPYTRNFEWIKWWKNRVFPLMPKEPPCPHKKNIFAVALWKRRSKKYKEWILGIPNFLLLGATISLDSIGVDCAIGLCNRFTSPWGVDTQAVLTRRNGRWGYACERAYNGHHMNGLAGKESLDMISGEALSFDTIRGCSYTNQSALVDLWREAGNVVQYQRTCL